MSNNHYNVSLDSEVLKIGFGEPAQNDVLVKDASANLASIIKDVKGQSLLLVNGPASLPVAFALCHQLAHIVGSIGVFDPKLNKYVIAVSHNPDYSVGDLIER